MRYIFLPPILACLLAACSDKDEKPDPKKDLPATTIAEPRLEEFTGARTKVVWTQYQNAEKIDKQGTSRHHHLYAIDTADGRGAHKVLEAEDNYAYPIITPDGEQIVFTRKVKITKGSKRTFETAIEIVNFDGSDLRKLRDGYAQEVWEDPETGKYWIYAGEEFVMGSGSAPICKRIIRFPLEDPDKSEIVWDRTEMGTDSFAISRDGKRFAGLFPWPQAGLGNLENGTWETLTNGCWTSIAPDNSYTSWVFDGPHRNLRIFDRNGTQTGNIRVNSHPALKGSEVYHPRWSNDVRFITLTGPHLGSAKKNRGRIVEVFIAKLSEETDRVEEWFQVTHNGYPDIYPDVWIEGGADHNHKDPAGTGSKPAVTAAASWPSKPDGLVFKWQNIRAKNEFAAPAGTNHVTRTEATGLAHYGPNYEMKLTGGTFVPILDADALLNAALEQDTTSFQALVTADSDSGSIFQAGGHSLSLDDGFLTYSTAEAQFSKFAKLPVGQPTHIALSYEAGKLSAYMNGQPVVAEGSSAAPSSAPADESLTFGKGFEGRLEHIAFYDRPLAPDEASADAGLVAVEITSRSPIERLQLKGKLVAVSPMPTTEEIAPYVRALVHYAYETDDPQHKEIAVAHWAILDSQTVSGLPREVGMTYDLTVEPYTAHPQLDSQAVSNEVDELLELYYDVTPLKQ